MYDSGDSDISVTTLIDAPQIAELYRVHSDEITSDVSDNIDSLFGQAMHAIIERSGTKGLIEERLYVEINGWRVSGQFDYIDEDGLLWDWKVVSTYEARNGLKPEREKQLNCYAHMARKNGYKITGLRIGFLFRDWKQSESTQVGYPPRAMVYPVPMWSDGEAEQYMLERVMLHQAARGATVLPECTEEERWAKQPTWAVMRHGNSKASRVLDTEEEAYRWLRSKGYTDGYVEYRSGLDVRCGQWCGVSKWCVQYNSSK